MRKMLPKKIKYLIFHTHVLSHVRYLLPIWGITTNSRLREIHVLLNKSLRYVKDLKYNCSTSLLYSKEILPVHKLVDYEILFFIFKIKNNIIKNNFTLREVSAIHEYPTRYADNYAIPYFRTTGGQSSILYRGLTLFNSLPADLKDELSISLFKKKLKSYLFEN